MLHYRAYGLNLEANCSLPGLLAVPPGPRPDARILAGSVPPALAAMSEQWYASAPHQPGGEPGLQVRCDARHQSFLFRYCDGAEFCVHPESGQIWADWAGRLALEDTATYVLGPVLGFLQRWRGITCLHASAVALGRGAIALVGPTGAGKSTTAAALARAGCPVLADDATALAETAAGFAVQPAYPRLRLWADAVNLLYGRPDALPRLVPNHPSWDKRFLDVSQTGSGGFQTEPLPLRALYLLAGRRAEATAPRLEAIAPQRALLELIANTYTNYLLDKSRRQQEFASLSRLVQRVPVRRLIPHRDPARLPDLVALLQADCPALAAAPSLLAR